jgi:diguanylate cyclase (GGDEF)-like protein
MRIARQAVREKLWLAYLSLGVLAVEAYLLIPWYAVGSGLYIALGMSSAAAILVGTRLHRPEHPLAWSLVALGPFFMSTADIVWIFYEPIFGIGVPYPSVADLFYLLGYFCFAAGLVFVQGRSKTSSGIVAVVDPLIITIAAGLLSWVFLMAPYADDKTLSVVARVVSISYPLVDVLLLAALTRFLMTPQRRVPAFYLLTVAMVSVLIVDSVYAVQALEGTYQDGATIDAGWLLFYVLLGSATLHPSMPTLSEPAPADRETEQTPLRRTLLVLASLMVPLVAVLQSRLRGDIDVGVIAGGSALMFSLVALRMEGMVNTLSKSLKERQLLQRQLEHKAWHDPLTGLANRGLFANRVEHALSRQDRLHRRIAVILIDLDGFKSVNDALGHEAGDELLVSVAKRLKGCLRPDNTVARLGGDEFAVLIEDILETSSAVRPAERLLAALGEPHTLGRMEVRVGASIGVAFGRSSKDSPDGLLADADAAMYESKAKGKMRYELFEPEMRTARMWRRALEADLQLALQREEFVLHYQPILALETEEIVEVEALVRWQHPERGLLAPSEFLVAAEESGLIIPIGRWVLKEACHQVRAWQEEHSDARKLALAVNLSTRELQHPSLVEHVVQALDESGLDPRCLKLEITEHTAAENAEATAERINELKALGVRLALDDFGSGYSALNYLRSFQVDTLKIDRSFVEGVGRDLQASSIVGAVVALAKTLNLSVTAEGTETKEQLDQVRTLGCDLVQGYYFSEPLAEEDIGAMLATTCQVRSA